MKRNFLLKVLASSIFIYFGCRQKKNDVFPVLDFIKSQVAKVDTSVYSIVKLIPKTDSTYDTTYVKREEFKRLAQDFLETPDISKTLGGKYTEERMMNNDLGLAVFIATPKDADLEVRRQEVRIEPNPPDDSATPDTQNNFAKIKSVYIEKVKNDKDSSVTKRMTWYADRKFQIVTISQRGNSEEKTSVVEVVWNQENE